MPVDFTLQSTLNATFHAAIIMDGNGRWAMERGLPRTEGHRRGADAAGRAIEAALESSVDALTLFAFSSDNWCRPRQEVAALMELFDFFLRGQLRRCQEEGIRLLVIGRRDRLSAGLLRSILATEQATASQQRLLLRIAIDYSSRYEILAAAASAGKTGDPEDVGNVARALHGDAPPVDLIIRTGREQRLSDFLLWEAAYAELCFLDTMWPDFQKEDFARAVRSFRSRQRRFGRLVDSVDSVHTVDSVESVEHVAVTG